MNTDIQPPAPTSTPSPAPGMDIQPPAAPPMAIPPESTPEAPTAQPEQDKKPVTKAPKAPKPPKQPGSGVGFAIAATVGVVLGLAALATYAYLQTQ